MSFQALGFNVWALTSCAPASPAAHQLEELLALQPEQHDRLRSQRAWDQRLRSRHRLLNPPRSSGLRNCFATATDTLPVKHTRHADVALARHAPVRLSHLVMRALQRQQQAFLGQKVHVYDIRAGALGAPTFARLQYLPARR